MGVLDFMGRQDHRGEWIRPRVSDEAIRQMVPTLDAEHTHVYLRIRTDQIGRLAREQRDLMRTYLDEYDEKGTMTFIVNQTTRPRKGLRTGESINHFKSVGVEPTMVAIREARIILREGNLLIEECEADDGPQELVDADTVEDDGPQEPAESKPRKAPPRRRKKKD